MATLEQKRAEYAWEIATKNANGLFKRLAKGAPALIMSNGLMPSLAFWWSKNDYQPIVTAIIGWLEKRKIVTKNEFSTAMVDLQKSDTIKFRNATEESLEFLKWLRNFASAVCKDE